jgi:hypothetical protein
MSDLIYKLTDGTEAVFDRKTSLSEVDKQLADEGLERDKKVKPFGERGMVDTALAKAGLPIVQGASNIIGLPGGVQQLFESGASKVASLLGYSPQEAAAGRMNVQLPRPSDITKTIGSQIPLQRAESFPGRTAQTAARNIMSAPLPGAVVPSLLSAVGEETLALPFKGTDLEPYARTVGAVATPLLSLPAAVQSPMQKMYAESTARMSPQEIQAASQLQRRSFDMNMPVTSLEAMQQTARGTTTLPRLQSQVEITPASAPEMAQFMGSRAESTKQALESQFPASARPTLGQNVQTASEKTIKEINAQIAKEGGPAFEAIKSKKIPQSWLTNLEKENPILAEASRVVDNNAVYQQMLKGYDKNSIARIEVMREYLQDKYTALLAQNQGKVTNEMRVYQEARTNLLDKADDIVRDYKPAREQYQQIRERLQAPIAGTPILDMAKTNELATQFGDLFAKNGVNIGLTPSKVSTTMKALAKQDPLLPKELLNQYLRSSLEGVQSAATSKAGTVGSRFADTIAKNTTQRANLEAAFVEVYGPNGKQASQGLNQMLDVLEAQGRRLPSGSATAERGMLAEESISTMSKIAKNPLTGLGNMYQNIFYGSDYQKIAKAITSHDGVKQLEKIAKLQKDKRQQGLAIVEFQRILEATDEPTNLGQ